MCSSPEFMRPLALIIACFVAGCAAEQDPTSGTATTPAEPVETASATQAESALTVTQEIAPNYTPGAPLAVKATLHYTGKDPVTAMALRAVLPQAWRYAGIQGELKPAVDPPVGATGEVTMIWIQIPSFPATVEYALDVPDWATGTYTVKSEIIYRTSGGELRSPESEASTTHAGQAPR